MMNLREFGPTRLFFMSAVEISDIVLSRMLKGLVARDPGVSIARFLLDSRENSQISQLAVIYVGTQGEGRVNYCQSPVT